MDYDYRKTLRLYLGGSMDTLESILGADAYSVNGVRLSSGVICVKYACGEAYSMMDVFPKLVEFNEYIISHFEIDGHSVVQELDYGSALLRIGSQIKEDAPKGIFDKYRDILAEFQPKIAVALHHGTFMLCNWGGKSRMNLRLIGKPIELAKSMALAGFQKNAGILISGDAAAEYGIEVDEDKEFKVGIVGEPAISVYSTD